MRYFVFLTMMLIIACGESVDRRNVDDEVVVGPDDEVVVGPDDEVVVGPDDEVVVGPDDDVVVVYDEDTTTQHPSTRVVDCQNEKPYFAHWIGDGTIEQTWDPVDELWYPSAKTCEWECDENFTRDEDECIADTRTVDCMELPEHADYVSGDGTYEQTWDGAGWYPMPYPPECDWECHENYERDFVQCVPGTRNTLCTNEIPAHSNYTNKYFQQTWSGTEWLPAEHNCPYLCEYPRSGDDCTYRFDRVDTGHDFACGLYDSKLFCWGYMPGKFDSDVPYQATYDRNVITEFEVMRAYALFKNEYGWGALGHNSSLPGTYEEQEWHMHPTSDQLPAYIFSPSEVGRCVLYDENQDIDNPAGYGGLYCWGYLDGQYIDTPRRANSQFDFTKATGSYQRVGGLSNGHLVCNPEMNYLNRMVIEPTFKTDRTDVAIALMHGGVIALRGGDLYQWSCQEEEEPVLLRENVQIIAGDDGASACFITDGKLFCWGMGQVAGQIEVSDVVEEPTQMTVYSDWISVETNAERAIGLRGAYRKTYWWGKDINTTPVEFTFGD